MTFATLDEVFTAYSRTAAGIDSSYFQKLCANSDLTGHGFTKADVDVIFAKVAQQPGSKFIGSVEVLRQALAEIAAKKSAAVEDIEQAALRAGSPTFAGVKADSEEVLSDSKDIGNPGDRLLRALDRDRQ
ncbi:hypothetical protein AB0C65_38645 [Nocardia sp. NPDC048505]|uniref:hypothetical protein n=1 Tax=Nocardia sp. NPDC048505 TaxID=3155756 RepID=UPI0033F71032